MPALFPLAIVGVVFFLIVRDIATRLRHDKEIKKTGIPYLHTIVGGNPGYGWHIFYEISLSILRWIAPALARARCIEILSRQHGWVMKRKMYDIMGSDTYFRASSHQNYLITTDADLIAQMAARKNDFEKPIENYGVVDIYGKNILTLNGEEWKRHKNVVKPAFSDKSNTLVWEESMRQAYGMLDFWKLTNEADDQDCALIPDAANETLLLALHVISGAGFGVPQLWQGQDERNLGKRMMPGLNTKELKGDHNVTFFQSLRTMVRSILWMAVLPVSVLRRSPFKLHKDIVTAFVEMGQYFEELADRKLRDMENGETDDGTMDLMGTMLRGTFNEKSKKGSDYLTRDEVIADSWIFLFAGHETSANALYTSLLFLAINIDTQKRLQSDIDRIASGRSPEEWSYTNDMRKFFNSMVGAVVQETLRLVPPVIDIPKVTRERETMITIDGKQHIIPPDTFIHFDSLNTHRNPKYYPHQKSKLTDKANDLEDFVPERWLPGYNATQALPDNKKSTDAVEDTFDLESFASSDGTALYSPPPGAFLAFSIGARGCPGRRFAQVESTIVTATIFTGHSIELDVSTWASDEEVARMNDEERRAVYKKALKRVKVMMDNMTSMITISNKGAPIPMRLVRRGKERFGCCGGLRW